jgi:hypothetical protein
LIIDRVIEDVSWVRVDGEGRNANPDFLAGFRIKSPRTNTTRLHLVSFELKRASANETQAMDQAQLQHNRVN